MSFRDQTRTPRQYEENGFGIGAVFHAALAVLLLMALLSYAPEDAAALSGGSTEVPQNRIGYVGAWVSFWAFHLFGVAAYLIEALLILRVIRRFLPLRPLRYRRPLAGGILMTLGLMILLALTPEICADHTDSLGIGRREVPQLALSGGVIGQWLAAPEFRPESVVAAGGVQTAETIPAGWLRMLIGAPGTMICAWTLLAAGALMIFFSDWTAVIFGAGRSAGEPREGDAADDDGESPRRSRLAALFGRRGGPEAGDVPDAGGGSAISRLLKRSSSDGAATAEVPAETPASPPARSTPVTAEMA